MKGSEFVIRNRFAKDVSGKDRSVRRFKAGLSDEAQKHGGKLRSFSIEEGTVRVSVEGEEASSVIGKMLEKWKRATVKLSESALAEFIEEDNLEEVRN